MILYVNGDSNTAAGEAVNDYCFAQDDSKYHDYGRVPHPDNLAVSWGQNLANKLDYSFYCDAESASSNQRIIRTTLDYLNNHKTPSLIVIGWSTWEREEWEHDGIWWQVNAGGIGDDWPDTIKQRYKNWVVNLDYQTRMNHQHRELHNFHTLLEHRGIPHYFFTCYEPFTKLEQLDWNGCYLEPYNHNYTFYSWCQNQGFEPVKPNSYHFGADAHATWAEFLYTKITESGLTK